MVDDRTAVQGEEEGKRTSCLSMQPTRPPAEVPGYQPERFLGQGAFGEVWVARDSITGLRKAIKFFTWRAGLDWSLLHREVEKLQILDNDRYIVQLYDVGWDAEPPYFVMDYMERGSLEELVKDSALPVEQAVALFREVAIGLSHAHRKGILHCDLKPANIMLDQDDKPRLADFGQARLIAEESPALGSWFYMPPEQADHRAQPHARWDVYALGVVLYRMLTGQVPYQSEGAVTTLRQANTQKERLEVYRKYLLQAPRPTAHRQLPDVDRDLANILDRCLAIEPKDRFPDVQAVLSALDARAATRARRPLLIMGILAPILVLVITLLAGLQMSRSASQDADQMITDRVQESNRLIARMGADTVAASIQLRWATLQREAAARELPQLLQEAHGQPQESAARQKLQEWIDSRAKRYQYRNLFATMSVFAEDGKFLAIAPIAVARGSLDKYFWHRDYLTGEHYDREPVRDRPRPPEVPIVGGPHMSVAFRSTAVGEPLLVIFSVPVRDLLTDKTLGVLNMAVELGGFSELRAVADGKKVVTLLRVRPDVPGAHNVANEGLILEHPGQDPAGDEQASVPTVYLRGEVLTRLQQASAEKERLLKQNGNGDYLAVRLDDYRDPLAELFPEQFAGRWLAVAEPIVFRNREMLKGEATAHLEVVNTGWVLLVQEEYAGATQAVRDMEWQFRLNLGFSLLGCSIVVLGLWFFIATLRSGSRSRLVALWRRWAGLGPDSLLAGDALSGRSASAAPRSGSRRTEPTSPGKPPIRSPVIEQPTEAATAKGDQ